MLAEITILLLLTLMGGFAEIYFTRTPEARRLLATRHPTQGADAVAANAARHLYARLRPTLAWIILAAVGIAAAWFTVANRPALLGTPGLLPLYSLVLVFSGAAAALLARRLP